MLKIHSLSSLRKVGPTESLSRYGRVATLLTVLDPYIIRHGMTLDKSLTPVCLRSTLVASQCACGKLKEMSGGTSLIDRYRNCIEFSELFLNNTVHCKIADRPRIFLLLLNIL